jgi:hypothetical protein
MLPNSRIHVSGAGPFARAPDFSPNGVVGDVLTRIPGNPGFPDDVDWRPAGGSSGGLIGVNVYFGPTFGTQIIGSIVPNTKITLVQLTIETPFSPGVSITFGTAADPSAFIDTGDSNSSQEGSYANGETFDIDTADVLILTVEPSGLVGEGILYYAIQF